MWYCVIVLFCLQNLDGGGSSTSVYRGKVINRPTCKDTPTICERPVSSITCIKTWINVFESVNQWINVFESVNQCVCIESVNQWINESMNQCV